MANESKSGVDRPVVLFLCRHNSARSQMAEALLRKYAGERFEVCSAGLEPTKVHPLANRVMGEIGINLNGQQAKGIAQFLGKVPVRVAISVCQPTEENCARIWPGVLTHLSWPFPDPAVDEGTEEERLARFREVRDRIDARIRTWLRESDGGTD
jgi:arsenate reductase